MNVYFFLLILEMEDSREFQTNNQDENKVVSHGTRNTSVEDVDFRPTEVK